MIKQIGLGAAVLTVALMMSFGAGTAHANKVDCTKVMAEVGAGKKTKDIAKDLTISTSSVYRCKSKAKAAKAKPSNAASPAAAPSPSTQK